MSHRFFRRDSKAEKSVTNGAKTNNNNNNNKKDFTERKATLTPLEFRVTQERETERPFSNKYNRHWDPGAYNCIVCNAELFQSHTKFESKSGWPAFSNVVDPKRVRLSPDLSHIGANLLLLIAKPDLARTEVSCAECNAHLGHLFKDGPKPTGLRYCINSSSLRFVPNNNGCIDYDSTDIIESPGEKEFPCNPENTCSKGFTNGNSSKDIQNNSNGASSRTSQTLPPMATLCLNNQACQRIGDQTSSGTRPSIKTEKLSNSTEAISTITTTANNMNRNITDISNTNNNDTTPDSPFSRTSSSRYPSSKGASLTAARISFFQTLTSVEPSNIKDKERTFPASRWGPSPSVTSVSNVSNYKPFVNRLVNSSSSNGLSTAVLKHGNSNVNTNTANHSILRRDSNGLFSKSVGVPQISSPPVPVKETSL